MPMELVFSEVLYIYRCKSVEIDQESYYKIQQLLWTQSDFQFDLSESLAICNARLRSEKRNM